MHRCAGARVNGETLDAREHVVLERVREVIKKIGQHSVNGEDGRLPQERKLDHLLLGNKG